MMPHADSTVGKRERPVLAQLSRTAYVRNLAHSFRTRTGPGRRLPAVAPLSFQPPRDRQDVAALLDGRDDLACDIGDGRLLRSDASRRFRRPGQTSSVARQMQIQRRMS
jgi:hypothetical protein